MFRHLRLGSVAVLIAFAFPAFALELGKAEGTMKAGDTTFKPKYAWAKTSAESGATILLLSDKPLAPSVLDSPSNHLEQLGAQVWNVQINEEGDFFIYPTTGGSTLTSSFEDEGAFTYTPMAVDQNSIEGKLTSKKGLEHQWSLDVRFHAAYAAQDDVFGVNPAVTKEFAARSSALADGAAKGAFTVGKNALELKHAYAKGKPASEGKQDVVLFLVDRPIDDTQLQNEVLNEDVNGLTMRIESGGELREIKWLHPDLNASDFGFDLGFFDPVVVAADRIEGRVYSVRDAAFRDTKYTYLVDFKAPVQTYAKPNEFKIDATNGKKLPKGGGDPGKVYIAYDKALRAKNIDQVLAIAGEEARQQFEAMTGGDRKEAVEMLDLLNALRASKITIVDGYSDGDRASLYVEGESEGQKEKGRVNMMRESGKWRIAKEMWGNVD